MFRFHDRTRILAACSLIAMAGLAAYANTFEAPFVFDGLPLENGLRALTWHPAEWFAPTPRTIAYFTFDLEYTLHGRWLPGFHAVNIAIHVVAALALFGAVLVTCRGLRMPAAVRRDAPGIALVSALLFELHPLQTQAVTYLYQRFESLMGMFFLLAVFCFAMAVRDGGAAGRRTGWLIASWVAVMLSIGSKEVGSAAPLVLLWYDRAFVAGSWRDLWTQRRGFYLPFLAALAAGLCYVYAIRDVYAAGGIFDVERMSPLAYALTQPEVICRYLRLTLWPRGLCLDWALSPATTPGRIVPPLVVLLVLLGFTTWSAVRLPAVGFLCGAFFLILAPTSSFAPIIDLAFEHRMYLPLAPLAVLLVLTSRAAIDALTRRLRATPHTTLVMKTVIAGCVAAALGFTTALRNEVYSSGSRLWRDVLEKVPDNARAYASLAWHIERETGDVATAVALNRHAVHLNPRIAQAHRELAILLHSTNQAGAIHHAREAVRYERNADNFNNLGIVIAATDPEEADQCFRAALTLDARHKDATLNLARLREMRFPVADAASARMTNAAPPATPRPGAERAAPPVTMPP